MRKVGCIALLLSTVLCAVAGVADVPDPEGDILVTFDNRGARVGNGSLSAPYSHRKRYSLSRTVRRDAAAVAAEYSLTKIDHWPIQALSIYCYVYRVPADVDRDQIIEQLAADKRIESVQLLQSFETSVSSTGNYDDEYANLQYGLDVLDIAAAHVGARGTGIRIAIVDSHADKNHEDLRGRIERTRVFANKSESADSRHGTAVASVIGARSNNSLGIVGVAPEAELQLYVSCWMGHTDGPAVCDSFSLAKALDAMLEDPPHILNLSLVGPFDPLLERLLQKALGTGVIVVAAAPPSATPGKKFPSSMRGVISVGSMQTLAGRASDSQGAALYAPGERILVAVPENGYDFRSGSSLAAAHVSGVVALVLSATPSKSSDSVRDILQRSQIMPPGGAISVNACNALNLSGLALQCGRTLMQSKRDADR